MRTWPRVAHGPRDSGLNAQLGSARMRRKGTAWIWRHVLKIHMGKFCINAFVVFKLISDRRCWRLDLKKVLQNWFMREHFHGYVRTSIPQFFSDTGGQMCHFRKFVKIFTLQFGSVFPCPVCVCMYRRTSNERWFCGGTANQVTGRSSVLAESAEREGREQRREREYYIGMAKFKGSFWCVWTPLPSSFVSSA